MAKASMVTIVQSRSYAQEVPPGVGRAVSTTTDHDTTYSLQWQKQQKSWLLLSHHRPFSSYLMRSQHLPAQLGLSWRRRRSRYRPFLFSGIQEANSYNHAMRRLLLLCMVRPFVFTYRPLPGDDLSEVPPTLTTSRQQRIPPFFPSCGLVSSIVGSLVTARVDHRRRRRGRRAKPPTCEREERGHEGTCRAPCNVHSNMHDHRAKLQKLQCKQVQ